MKTTKKQGMTAAGQEIAAALSTFRDALKGDSVAAKKLTVRMVKAKSKAVAVAPSRAKAKPKVSAPPSSMTDTPKQIRQLRDQFNTSQPLFAKFLGVSVKTLRSWEQGNRTPSPMACRFIEEI